MQQLWVLVGASLFQCALVGVLINSSGTFLAEIRAEYGFSMSRISSFNILKSVSGALGGTLVTALLFKRDGPKFLLGVIFLEIAGFLLLIFGADTWLWYISPILLGPSSPVSIIAVPYLLNHRIPEHAGSATGIAMAFSGLGGVIFNPLSAALIDTFCWKKALFFLCVITILISSVGVFFIFYGAPHGITTATPSMISKKNEQHESNAQMRKRFVLCCLCMLAGNVCVPFVAFVNIFAEQIGYSLVVGATLASAIMTGNITGKLFFGLLCDCIGTWKAMIICLIFVFCGTVGFVFFQQTLPILYVAAILFGFCYALAAVAVSKCILAAYDIENGKYYSGIHTSINCAVGAISSLGIGALYDVTDSFIPMLFVIALSIVLSLIATMILNGRSN